MKPKKTLLLLITLLSTGLVWAQPISQTVRGTVVDKISQTPIPGAVIQLLNSTPPLATTTDENGKFKLANVPIGKQGLKVSFLGYKENTLQNLTVNSGKELVLTVSLEEDITQMTEVVVSTRRLGQ
jgi:hypothetical protein